MARHPVSARRPTWRVGQPTYLWLFLAGLAANVFSGHTKELGLPIGPDRLLLPMALLLLLLHPGRRRMRWGAAHVGMGLLLVLVLGSMLVTGTWADPIAQFAFLDRLAWPFVAFAVGPLIFDTARRRELLLRFLTLVGAWLAVGTFLEVFGPRSLVWPRYIVAAIPVSGEHRASGPFLASEALGMALAVSAFAALALAVAVRGWWRGLAALVAPASLLAAVLTLTRSVWLGALVGVVVVFAVTPAARRAIGRLAVVGAGAAAATVVAAPDLVETLGARLETNRSLFDRANTNAAALRVLEHEPLTGVGWGRFVHVGSDWVRQSPDYPLTAVRIEIHNVVLSRAAELGLPGAALFVAVVALGPVAVLASRSARADRVWLGFVAACLAVWIVPSLTSPNPYPYPNLVVWLLAGVLGAATLTRPAAPPPVGAPTPPHAAPPPAEPSHRSRS